MHLPLLYSSRRTGRLPVESDSERFLFSLLSQSEPQVLQIAPELHSQMQVGEGAWIIGVSGPDTTTPSATITIDVITEAPQAIIASV